jgi:imidazole glycerol-phosphate synthase subunit HisH
MTDDETAAPHIAIVGYGGSARSVQKAFEYVGATAVITLDHNDIASSDGIVLPGGLSFGHAMAQIRTAQLKGVLGEALKERTSVLGIGLGMHLFYEHSAESDDTQGLGFLSGAVELLPSTLDHKVPYTARMPVTWHQSSPLRKGLDDACKFPHGHSYAVVPEDDHEILATAEHAEEFVTAVQRGTIYGVQFHPEKSRPCGLQLLKNYVAECTRTTETRTDHG